MLHAVAADKERVERGISRVDAQKIREIIEYLPRAPLVRPCARAWFFSVARRNCVRAGQRR